MIASAPLLLALVPHASAATLTVGPSGDYATIQLAIDEADPEDRIEVSAGTYAESLSIEKHLEIVGVDGSGTTFLTADEAVTITGATVRLEGFDVATTATSALVLIEARVELVDLRVSGGSGGVTGGGLTALDSTLVIEDCTFEDNKAVDGNGGHVYADNSVIDVSDSTFTLGRAQRGGAFYLYRSSLVAQRSTFSSNKVRLSSSASRGGAIRAEIGDVTLTGCTFEDNVAVEGFGGHVSVYEGTLVSEETVYSGGEVSYYYGGAIAVSDGDVTLSGDTFVGNSAVLLDGEGSAHGGALYVFGDAATWDVSDTTFEENVAEGWGGGVHLVVGDGTFTGATFTGNYASYGAAYYTTSPGTQSVVDSTFELNEGYYGSAIRAYASAAGAELTIEGSTFSENSALVYGGAIYLRALDSLVIDDSVFASNTADVGGAAMLWEVDAIEVSGNVFCANNARTQSYSDGGAIATVKVGASGAHRYANNVFAENVADAYGGAISLYYSGDAEVVNNTFLGNRSRASELGGVLAARQSVASFVNNAVAYTTGGGGLYADDVTAVVLAYDAFFESATADLVGELAEVELDETHLFVAPGVVEWSADGDCTNDTFWLTHDSPLHDAGDPSILDPDGSVSDIGAYGGPDADPAAHTDADGDGWAEVYDCDDADAGRAPDLEEVPYNGVDDDCDGHDLSDLDEDGFDATAAGGEDCDDEDAAVHPDAEETWYDGVDQDCDGADDFDQDGDGHASAEHEGADCDDLDPGIHPDAEDGPGDGVDQDCDGKDASEAGEDPVEKEGCGCATGGPAGIAGLLWLPVLLLRRRSRSR